MGQKTNATIFRLRPNSNWGSKFFERKTEETTLFSYRNLEIKKYIEQFLKINGLILHSYKLHYTESSLHVFLSYYTSLKTVALVNQINSTQNVKLLKKVKTVQSKNFLGKKKVRMSLLNLYKRSLHAHSFKKEKGLKQNSFVKSLVESLNLFTKEKLDILVTFQSLNKGLSLKLGKHQSTSFQKMLLLLRRDSKHSFFKEAVNILLISVTKKNSALLLSEFIASQLSKLTKAKRHRFFLIFLKKTLNKLMQTNLSRVNGVKIIVTGRLNGAPRSKKHSILVGRVPLQKLTSEVNYNQSISYTQVGTFGIKVWICEN